MADSAEKVKKIIKQSIETNTPVKFFYNSKHSEYKKGEEAPAHLRSVQPVVFGYRLTKNDGIKYYFRAYLLGLYSYSKNSAFTGDLDSKKTPEYWRVYDISKVSNIKLVPEWPYRFYPQNHSEYNPNDKWMDGIRYRMPFKMPVTKPEDKNKKKGIFNSLFGKKENKTESFRLYATSENEEIGYVENNLIYVNEVWLEQTDNMSEIHKGLKSLLEIKNKEGKDIIL